MVTFRGRAYSGKTIDWIRARNPERPRKGIG